MLSNNGYSVPPDENVKKESISGIVYKMDHSNRRALVRVLIEQDDCDVEHLLTYKYEHIDINHLFISFDSMNNGMEEVEMGFVVKIFDYEGPVCIKTTLEAASNYISDDALEITKYIVNQTAFYHKRSDELVAVTEVHGNYLKIVGGAFGASESIIGYPRNADRGAWIRLPTHSFICGDLIYLPENFWVVLEHGAPKIIYDHNGRQRAIQKYKEMEKEGDIDEYCAARRYHLPLITRIRQLTPFEEQIIKQQTRNLKDITCELAKKYVLEPLLTSAILEKVEKKRMENEFTCEVLYLKFDVDRNCTPHKYSIFVRMTDAMQKCLTERSPNTWHLGEELVLSIRYVSDFFLLVDGQQDIKNFYGNISLVIEETNLEIYGAKYIRLGAAPGYEQVLVALNEERGIQYLSGKHFFLGPKRVDNRPFRTQLCHSTSWLPFYRNIREEFDKFYKKDLFEAFVGRTSSNYLENMPDLTDQFNLEDNIMDDSQKEYVKTACTASGFTCLTAPPGSGKTSLIPQIIGCKPRFAIVASNNSANLENNVMDDSQKEAVRTACTVPGFTCLTAPPGSGKTSLIPQIIACKADDRPRARFAIVASNNSAVTNAVNTLKEETTCIRQFSPNAQADLVKNSPMFKISLLSMIRSVEIIQPYLCDVEFANAVLKRDEAKIRVEKEDNTIEEQIRAANDFQNAEALVGRIFLRLCAPTVFATTSSMLSNNIHKGISHLIIDEATQMTQMDALFMYCRLPDLTHITLFGDDHQLRPFTILREGSLPYELMSKGELNRLQELNSTNKVELEYIYRNHPKIVDLLLRPLYGNQLKSAPITKQLNLAEQKGLPRAKDGTPCLFVQVDGVEDKGRNQKEIEAVLKFLEMLRLKGINPEDVNIIAHHKNQKDSLCRALKGKGNFGLLKLQHVVSTVEGYQGRDAKIVLILTTKTCKSSDPKILDKVLSFVSDPNREVVALSRGQHAVYIFGNWKQLAKMTFWENFGPRINSSGAFVNENWQHLDKTPWDLGEEKQR